MLPLGHAAFGYLIYVGYASWRGRPRPADWALLPLAVGTQFPDLIDKPLAFYDVIAYGRSLAHSVFALILITGVVRWGSKTLRTRDSTAEHWDALLTVTPAAFGVGYVSHVLGDLSDPLLAGTYDDMRFVLYPIYRIPGAPGDDVAPWIRLLRIYREMGTHPQMELILLALVVFASMRVRDRSG